MCDTLCCCIKIPKKEKESFRAFLNKYLESEKEFEVRFGLVMLFRNYTESGYIKSTLNAIKNSVSKDYYSQMGAAWALSVCYVKFPEDTLELFAEKSLDRFVQNKAIQKCRESLRVSQANKEKLKQYRII